ncbi:unnamed protein product [Trichogramma brassicae]|uniref:Uncharacterized protein n=1 Tax=Trichogramma brassicae TaxID=86971 RepID=A0A6H5J301_9HYME|nr:unnamed protein product [Trichogramma brassicae]
MRQKRRAKIITVFARIFLRASSRASTWLARLDSSIRARWWWWWWWRRLRPTVTFSRRAPALMSMQHDIHPPAQHTTQLNTQFIHIVRISRWRLQSRAYLQVFGPKAGIAASRLLVAHPLSQRRGASKVHGSTLFILASRELCLRLRTIEPIQNAEQNVRSSAGQSGVATAAAQCCRRYRAELRLPSWMRYCCNCRLLCSRRRSCSYSSLQRSYSFEFSNFHIIPLCSQRSVPDIVVVMQLKNIATALLLGAVLLQLGLPGAAQHVVDYDRLTVEYAICMHSCAYVGNGCIESTGQNLPVHLHGWRGIVCFIYYWQCLTRCNLMLPEQARPELDLTGAFIPNHRDIFREGDIESLLNTMYTGKDILLDNLDRSELIGFFARTGYKDEPKVGEDGKPLLRRTTVVHRAARRYRGAAYDMHDLFQIFNRFDVNYVDEDGVTHFHIACRYGCDDVVETFLDLGRVDPNACLVTKTGNSPLHLALEHAKPYHFEVAALLLRGGADPNSTNFEGSTPLHFVSQNLSDDPLRRFFWIVDELNLSVHIDARDKVGVTPLILAMYHGRKKKVESLLRRGANPKLSIPRISFTPLHVACMGSCDRIGLMKIFFVVNDELSQSVEVDARDKWGRTPLHYAVAKTFSAYCR